MPPAPRSFGPGDHALLLEELERVAMIGCYVWDVSDKQVVWSDGFYRVLGLLPSDGTESPQPSADLFFARVHADDRQRVRAAHARILSEGVAPDTTYRIVRPDGQVRVLRGHGAVVRDDSGAVARVSGAIVDVTELSLAAHRLAEADVLLAEIQRAVKVGSHVFDLTTMTRTWSPPLYDILGVDPAVEPSSELSMQLTHPDDRLRQIEWGMRVAQGEDAGSLVVRIVRPDGAVRSIETRARRVESDAGPRIMGITLDITARVELEESLRQAAKLEAVGMLAAGVAHDFNNYLGVMMLEASSVERLVGPESRDVVEPLRVAIERCGDLTRQLLTFARKQAATPKIVDLGALVQTTAALFSRLAGPTVRLDVGVPEAPVHVLGDPGQLDSIVMNLLLNARDATSGPGTIAVDVALTELCAGSAVLPTGHVPGPHVVLRVTDTGTGIPSAALPRIFEPYFSTKELARGTGLGLASVHAAVTQLGGFIRVESAEGRGSTFAVHLPAAERKQELRATAAQRAPMTLDGTILIVEDVAPLLEVAARILRAAGLTVHTAGSGDAALAMLRTMSSVDVVLTDLLMPGMNGFELARALPESAAGAQVLFMSGYADGAVLERLEREAPGCPLVRKPFDADELLRAVSEALERARAAATV